MLDAKQSHKQPTTGNGTAARWRGAARSQGDEEPNGKDTEGTKSIKHKDGKKADAEGKNDVDLMLIQRRTYLLSAGIGDTNKTFNKYKGKIGLVVWTINIVIHFGLDFYEANTIFDTSWATCIGLFFFTLVACCISMIKHSIPWFIKGVKKLKKDGHYPKTLRRVQLLVRYLPFGVLVFAVGAAVGQFGCYWADDALKVNFNPKNSSIIQISPEVEVLLNILRATSLIHIFYGFCSLLLFHMTLLFMLQSSMHEYNDRMGRLFREVPIGIGFSDAVNLFSARAKFVREGSKQSSVVLTTLLVACCTSFVLNAYNFLFLKKHAIYIWFALAPLIWAVVPLMGAAWVTKTYNKYKFVVVNAWVDIPDEHELEAQAHEALHQSHANKTRPKTPVKRMWGSIMGKVERKGGRENGSSGNNVKTQEKAKDEPKETKVDIEVNENVPKIDKKPSSLHREPEESAVKFSPSKMLRRNSDGKLRLSSQPSKEFKLLKRASEGVQRQTENPTILFTDYDGNSPPRSPPPGLKLQPIKRNSTSDSSLTEVMVNDVIRGRSNEGFGSQTSLPSERKNSTGSSTSLSNERQTSTENPRAVDKSMNVVTGNQLGDNSGSCDDFNTNVKSANNSTREHKGSGNNGNDVCLDIEPSGETDTDFFPLNTPYDIDGISNPTYSRSNSSSSCPSPRLVDEARSPDLTSGSASPVPGTSTNGPKTNLMVPQSENGTKDAPPKSANFLTGMAKTFHKWRTKTKKKKHFNYEKYITYLESILPTVGFSVGGVIITWNGIYTFIVIMTFLVGVFAQEAFFGN